MENKSTKEITRLNALLIIISTVAACLILISFILHIKIIELEAEFINFATHHYFLVGFISLIVMAVCIKLYNDTPERISSFNIFKQQTRNKRLLKKIQRVEQYKKQLRLKIENAKSRFIEKENVAELTFPSADVLESLDDINQREIDLKNSLMLGNCYKHKVKIYFKDIDSNKHIETTVWQLDSKVVTIKSGITLPVRSVYKVEI
jgi:hypothetical protein